MSFIGGCSKATQDIPPYMLADGNPAEIRSINSVGLQRRGVPEEIRKNLKDAFRILYRENLSTQQALQKIRAGVQMGAEIEHLVKFISESQRGITK